MSLAAFIRQNAELIAKEWEEFARTCEPAAATMNVESLRDHILPLLIFVADDMETMQTALEQSEKGKGKGPGEENESAAKVHAALRVIDGFTADQVVAEFRALRASILRLWVLSEPITSKVDVLEVVRFSESIDQMLSESIVRHGALETLARESSKRRDAFLATLSHELRNPLSALHNSLLVITQIGVSDARLANVTRIMHRQTQHLRRLLDDLLDLARISANRIALKVETTDLRECITDAVDGNREILNDRKHTLTLDLPAGPVFGQVDSTRIMQVVSNLLNNAAKFSPPGSAINVSLVRQEDSAVIVVADNGKGIEAHALQKIFTEFYSDHENDLGKTGLGIGLKLAKTFVELHGGTLTATSDGNGATFRASIPLQSN